MRYLFFAIGAFLLVNAIVIMLVSNMHLGIVATLVLGALFVLFGAFYNKLPIWLKTAFFAAFVIAMAAVIFLVAYGERDSADGSEDALIVLGAGLRGDVPSKLLASRLDAAAEYYEKNPDVIIVVSGGQGADELISEALAMERYLIARGVDAGSIIKEDRSTSTAENFAFSKKLLDSHFDNEYSVAYATSNYHVFRAGLIAGSCGIKAATHIGGEVSWYSIIPGAIRECMATVRHFLP